VAPALAVANAPALGIVRSAVVHEVRGEAIEEQRKPNPLRQREQPKERRSQDFSDDSPRGEAQLLSIASRDLAGRYEPVP